MKRSKLIIIQYIFVILSILSFSHCSWQKDGKQECNNGGIVETLHYAKGFQIIRYIDYTYISVLNPWDTTQILHEYFLIPDTCKTKVSLKNNATLIHTPIHSVSVLGAVHAGMLEQLGAIGLITSVADSKYMKLPFIQEKLENNSIFDLGVATQLNIERLIESSPDAVFVTPYPESGYGRLEKTGFPLIECVEYMENTPLGRCEWIKFIGAFLGKEKEADSIYNEIEQNYLKAVTLAQTATQKPTVFSEKKYGGTWFLPGGASYMSIFFKDAGGDYIWKDNQETGSIALSFEEVYEKAENADFWVIRYFDPTGELRYSDIKSEYEPYTFFNAWKNRHIIGCNTAKTAYYEKGIMQPHLILKDLIKIFHPELLPEYEPSYFNLLP